jgi:hypothetical protein
MPRAKRVGRTVSVSRSSMWHFLGNGIFNELTLSAIVAKADANCLPVEHLARKTKHLALQLDEELKL